MAGGYPISEAIRSLQERFSDNELCRQLSDQSGSGAILDLVAQCLLRPDTRETFASIFAPIILDSFYRILNQNGPNLSLFITLARLHGRYVCATRFCHICFRTHLFKSENLLNECQQNPEMLRDFFECCFILINYDLDFFSANFDWSFIVKYRDAVAVDNVEDYIRVLAWKIYAKITGIGNSESAAKVIPECYRLDLALLINGRCLQYLPDAIQYAIEIDNDDHQMIIRDEDFISNVVSVKGILLPKVPKTANCDDGYIRLPTFEQSLRLLAMGVSLATQPILVQGPMGCGKSTLIRHLAHLTGRCRAPQIQTIQISDQVDTKYLLGSYVCTDVPGEFRFNFGPLLMAARDGNWIVLEDIDTASSDLINSIVSIIESNNGGDGGGGQISGCEGKLESFHPDFRLFFTRTAQDDQNSLGKMNFKMLEKMCYAVTLGNVTKEEIGLLIQQKWPNLRVLVSRIGEFYQEFNRSPPGKRWITLRDLMKWCYRFSSYFEPNQASAVQQQQFAFLDAADCFLGFLPYRDSVKEVAYMLGSNFNLSRQECKHLLEDRSPCLTKHQTLITIGRESMTAARLSQQIPDFAFTIGTTQLLEKLFVCVKHDEPVLLCGETGVGKTSCIQYLANLCGRRLIIVNMNQQSNSAELFGGYKPVDFEHIFSVTKVDYLLLFSETFNTAKNATFREKFDQLWQKQDWKMLIQIMIHVCQRALDKTQDNRKDLYQKWIDLNNRLKKYSVLVESQKKLTFTFLEGVLTQAIRTGQWVLLDEINLAENETLQSLLSFLENDKTLMLFEKLEDQLVPVHRDFRLFACMNPATDIGKKELPQKIRTRFTEFFIEDVKDQSQLRIIVNAYIQNMMDKSTVESIVQLYFRIKQDAEQILKDMNGHRPVFSLRNLCRALRVAKSNPFKSIHRSLYEGFCLAFLSNLDEESYRTVQNRIESIMFPGISLTKLLAAPLDRLFPSEKFALVQNYPILKGSQEPMIDQTYILTATVMRNLKDICRIISAGKMYPILLQGETSVGKTSMIQWLAKATGNVCHRVNNHEHTDLQEYVGSYCSEPDGRIVFRTGVLVDAMKNGHWIILDELNLAPTEVLEALNRVLDDNREIFIPETQETIQAHPRFLLFATQNPPGNYGGRKILSRAFRNRFIELNFNEIPLPELEIILHQKCSIPLSYAKRMVSVLSQLQKRRCKSDIFAGKHGFITLRDLFRWGYRYRKFAANQDSQVKFYDWNLFLANQGYMLLAGRVRNQEDTMLIKEILEDSFRCQISIEELFYGSNFDVTQAPPKFDNIVWTKAFRRLGTLLQQAILYQEPVLLVGETGCGKTTICQYFAALGNKALKIINCHMNTESSDFLGSLRPNRNPDQSEALFEWVDGPLINAMRSGDYFLVDEISLADDSVLERLNSVLEPERSIFLAEKSGQNQESLIGAHPEFRYFATMNPGGDYGKKELSPALRDRFTEIWCPAFEDMADIEQIVFHNLKIHNDSARSTISKSICDFLEWLDEQILSTVAMKNNQRSVASIRDIISWVQFINSARCLTIREAFQHGAYSVFIDSIGASQNFRFALKNFDVNEARTSCNERLETLAGKIPCDVGKRIIKDSDGYFMVGPFPIEMGHLPRKESGYDLQCLGVQTNLIRIARAMQLEKPILLEGPPGVGKTSLVQALANITGHQLIRINLSDQTDISDLFGCDLPLEGDGNAGRFSFCDGPFLSALKSDSTWILLDELNLASQTVLEGLNACLDHRGEIYIAELNKTFHVNKRNTRIFASQNPFSMDGTRKGLPKSFLNRFTTVYVSELNDKDFQQILSTIFPQIESSKILQMVSVNRRICEMIRQDDKFAKKGGPFEFNLRDLIRWAQLSIKFKETFGKNPLSYIFFNLIYMAKMRMVQDREKMVEIYQQEGYFKLEPEPTYFFSPNFFQFGYSVFQVDVPSKNRFTNRTMNYLLNGQKDTINSILKCIEMQWLTILIGDGGCGKTHLVRMIADMFGKRLNVLHVNPEMDTIDLLGGFEQKDFYVDLKRLERKVVEYGFECLTKSESNLSASFLSCLYWLNVSTGSEKYSTIESILSLFQEINSDRNRELGAEYHKLIKNRFKANGEGIFVWRDSLLVEAIQRGDWVLIDNANFLNPAVLDRLNSLLEQNGSLTINERGSVDGTITTIFPHEDFRLFLAVNPNHGELSRAMRNRGIEIVLDLNVNPKELGSIALNHGFQPEEAILSSFSDYDSFFKFVTESILKNQHGFAPVMAKSSLNPLNANENVDLLVALPVNLNHLANDPELYRAVVDHSVLRPFEDPTQMRLLVENGTVMDEHLRNWFWKNRSPYKTAIKTEWLWQFKQIPSKLFARNDHPNDQMEIRKFLPFEFQENSYLFHLCYSKEEERKSRQLHFQMLWIDLKQRLSRRPRPIITDLLLLDEFYRATISEIDAFLEILEYKESHRHLEKNLIAIYQLLLCIHFDENGDWRHSFREKFVPFWYITFLERDLNNFFISGIPERITSIAENISQKFSILPKIDSREPYIKLLNYYHLKLGVGFFFDCHDFETFKQYRNVSKLLRLAAKNTTESVELIKLNQCCLEITNAIVDYYLQETYFEKNIHYQNVCRQLSIQRDLWSKKENPDGRGSPEATNVLSICHKMLTTLFSWIDFVGTFSDRKYKFPMLNLSGDISKLDFFIDPFLIIVERCKMNENKNYPDLLEEMFAHISDEWNIRQLFKVLNLGNNPKIRNLFKIIHQPNFIDHITFEFLPIFSLIFSNVFGQENDSFRLFGQKKSSQDLFRKLLISNYFSIRSINISERYSSLGHQWAQRFEQSSQIQDVNCEPISRSINLIWDGYAVAKSIIPKFDFDPAIAIYTTFEKRKFEKVFILQEMKLRHELCQRTYGYHNPEFDEEYFDSSIFKFPRDPTEDYNTLQTLIERFTSDVVFKKAVERICRYRKNWSKYLRNRSAIIAECGQLLKRINSFLKTIRNYASYRDLTISFMVSLQILAKGLQMTLIELNWNSNKVNWPQYAIKHIPDLIEWLAKFFTPKIIYDELVDYPNRFNYLLIIYEHFDLDTNWLMKRLIEMLELELRNVIALVDYQPKLLFMYFQVIREFVNKWIAIEKKAELDQIQKNALFHIKLDDDRDPNETNAVEKIFPTFYNVFQDLMNDDCPPEEGSGQVGKENETGDVTKEMLVHLARSNLNMVEWLETKPDQIDFKKPYLIRHKIASQLLNLDLGLNSSRCDPLLLDGYLIGNNHLDRTENGDQEATSSFNIYHDSISSETEKCYQVLESLRITIVEKLLPEFENHPALLKLVQIIERTYEIKANRSLMCLATGLELVLKASEQWQQIAHRGISLVEHQNQITELLVRWRKMEINYWANCLDMVSKQIEEKELSVWWIRFYTTIKHMISHDECDENHTKEFIHSVKKLMENSTLGQFSIRLKIIKAFVFFRAYYKTAEDAKFKMLETSLRNIHDFYHHFSASIAKHIEQEKSVFEKDIKQFVTIAKWNPNNFWSLKESLARSKKQLYGYIKKYELALSKPANQWFHFESKDVRSDGQQWKMPVNLALKQNATKTDVRNYKLEQFEHYSSLLSNADRYLKRTDSIGAKIFRSVRRRIHSINRMEESNCLLIGSIQEYSNLKVNETKDLERRKKMIGQIQTRKRRALSDLFKALHSQLGLSFRRGANHYDQFDLGHTLYSIQTIKMNDAFPEQTRQNVEACNFYYYRCLSHYARFVQAMEKPNAQLTLDMVDRIKGYVVDLAQSVAEQRRIISQFSVSFGILFDRYLTIKRSINLNDNFFVALNSKSISRYPHRTGSFGETHLKLLSHLTRMKVHAESLNGVSDFNASQLDPYIEKIKNIKHFQDDQFPIFTETRLEELRATYLNYLSIIQEVAELFYSKHPELALIYINPKDGEGLTNIQYYINEDLQYINHLSQLESFSLLGGFDSDCEQVLKHVMLSFQKIFKSFLEAVNEVELDADKNLLHQTSFAKVLDMLNPSQMNVLVDEFFDRCHSCLATRFYRNAIDIVGIILCFLDRYTDMAQLMLTVLLGSLKTSSKLLDILLTLSNELLVNGFCLPPDLDPEAEKTPADQRKNVENSGFGEGETTSDAQDVSDRLDCQDQLDELERDDGGDGDQQDESLENAENGIEMDDDFDGQEHGADKPEHDDDCDSEKETEDDQDLMEQMGHVDDDEQVLDENLWGDQDDDEDENGENEQPAKDEDKDGQHPEGKEQLDSRTVANKDNEKLNSAKEERQELDDIQLEDQNDGNELNENYNDDGKAKDVGEEKHPEMVLPEQIELDMDDGDGGDDAGNDMETTSDKDTGEDDGDVPDDPEDDGHNIDAAQDDNGDAQDEEGGMLNDEGKNDLGEQENDNENDGKEPAVEVGPRDHHDDRSFANTELQNNGGQVGQEDKKDNERQTIGNRQSVEAQSARSAAKSSGDRSKASEQKEDDEQVCSMTRQNQKRTAADQTDSAKAKRRKIVQDEEKAAEQANSSDQFRHTETEKTEELAFDLASGDDDQKQLNPQELEREVNFKNEDEEPRSQADKDVVIQNITNMADSIKIESDDDDDDDQQSKEKKIQGDLVATASVDRPSESTFHTGNPQDDVKMEPQSDQDKPAMLEDEVMNDPNERQSELWQTSKQRIESLLYELCNQLQLVLEPTKRAKYQGDFKTGKRLHMKKVITYVASQFRKDKIWLRRMRPSKRQYQIIIAVDDSLSMFDNQSRIIALESLVLMGKALSIIESGLLSVLSFGEQVRVLHPFGQPFTDETAGKMFDQFTFDQRRTKTNELLQCALAMFDGANGGSSSAVTSHQLLVIISDGRGVHSEGGQILRQTLVRIKERNIFTVYIIVDNPDHKSSILDIRVPVFNQDGSMEMVSYMEKFPFPYYIILKEIQALPAILGEALRQWFELISH